MLLKLLVVVAAVVYVKILALHLVICCKFAEAADWLLCSSRFVPWSYQSKSGCYCAFNVANLCRSAYFQVTLACCGCLRVDPLA